MDPIEPTDGYGSDNPLSRAIVHDDIVYVSGIVGRDPDAGTFGETISSQTRFAIETIDRTLASADSSLEALLRVIVYLADMNDKEDMNDVYRKHIPEPYPARAVVGAELAGPAKVEIVVTAYRSPRP